MRQKHIQPTIRKNKPRLGAKAGFAPESFVYIGKERTEKVQIHSIQFDITQVTEKQINNIQDLANNNINGAVEWINIIGLQDTAKIIDICNHFQIHPLIIEDILNTQQRPKVEEFEKYLFITFKNILLAEDKADIEYEQISIIFGDNYILTFHESDMHVFADIVQRIHSNKGSLRNRKADYLLYKILDTVVDNYFLAIDKLGDKIEELEEETYYYPTQKTTFKIQSHKKEVQQVIKQLSALREILNKLDSNVHDWIDAKSLNYFRDVHDHTYQAIDGAENYRSLLNDLMNIYFSTVSNKLNQVMKVLTFISTLFMPLSFIAGVYGMNFTHFPGMNSPYAYYIFWIVCIVITISMVYYFKKRKWF